MVYDISVLSDETFLHNYFLYKQKVKIQDLIDFLDNIDTNKKYYKMTFSRNKRYIKNVTDDTQSLKNINSFVNRLTDMNYESLKPKIISQITQEHIVPYIIENIVEKAILHHIYIPLYVGILKDIPYECKYSILEKLCNKYHSQFFERINDSEESKYLNLCKKNKNIDNIIGYSLFITHLEKDSLINDYVEKVLEPFMKDILDKENDESEIYKILTSFSNISKIRYTDGIPKTYYDILKKIQTTTKFSKIRFYIMDILGE